MAEEERQRKAPRERRLGGIVLSAYYGAEGCGAGVAVRDVAAYHG